MGVIDKYFPEINVAAVTLTNGSLKVGDEVIIMSKNSDHDTFFHQIIKDIQIKGEKMDQTSVARENNTLQITIGVDEPVQSDGIDGVYKFTKETYGTGAYKLK